MAWRDTIAAARKRVHDTFRVRAVYMTRADAEGVVIYVRYRQRQIEVQMPETGAPTTLDVDETLLFDAAEIPAPRLNAYVIVSATEGYRVGATEPEYLGTITATVTRLADADAASLWAIGRPDDF